MKKSREEIAYEFLKDAGPCVIQYGENNAVKILLTSKGEAFWFNDPNGPEIPFITLDEVLAEAKELLLTLFTADMDTELTAEKLYALEDELRVALKKTDLSAEDVRELKIKFLDVKEEVLATQ